MNVFDYLFEDTKSLDKNFIINKNFELSYFELYDNAIKLASFIRKSIGSRNNVILIAQNSPFFVIVYLAILKSGNTCIPLNSTVERANLDRILKKTSTKMLFATDDVLSKYDFGNSIVLVSENKLSNIVEFEDLARFEDDFDGERIAEIIYTSGTTADPKGVMISHNNIIANTDGIIKYLELTSKDIICVVLPFYYCYGLSLLHTHLKVGGAMVLNNSFMFFGTVINDLLNYKCTGFAGVPSHFQLLLKKSNSFITANFDDLRYVTQAGGKLPNIFIKEFVKYFSETKFFIMYGQTEATARLSFLDPSKVLQKIGSIGKAIQGVELRIVDKSGKEVGFDKEGELIAKGQNIMKGYYKDEKSTSNVLKNGWLYTGDIAKQDKDGYIYIVARKKEIIKVFGYRVSPKEIEDVICSVPSVIDCVVVGIEDEIQGEAIKAKIFIDNIEKKNELKHQVIEKCKEKLASYKIPHFFEYSDQLSFKSSGKKI